MNNYEDWAQLVAKNLAHEADYIAAIDKDELDDKAATEAFVRAVLKPFLPENYGIGAGRIVDAFGNSSDYLDIIVYNRDFPRIGMRATHNAYLYESVVAAFAIRAKFIRKTFFDSLNACASLSHLETRVDQTVLVKLAKKNGLKPGPNKSFIHDDPLHTGRFELIGRPPAFVFGFSGIKYSYRQLQDNIELWIGNRQNVGIPTPMKSLPAVIATQGCFAWRNAAPLALSNREMLGIGNDEAPVRLIALQLLYLLNRRLNVTSDGYGLKPNLNAYLSQFSAPKFEIGVGDVAEASNPRQAGADSPGRAARDTQRFESARDHAAIEEAAKAAAASTAAVPKAPEPKPAPPPVQKPAAASPQSAPLAANPAPVNAAPTEPPAPSPAAAAPAEAAVFDKPSPFASAPIPAAKAPAAEREPADSAVFDKPSPFASAPVPAAEAPAAEAPRSPAPMAPLGSAPIPAMPNATSSMPVPDLEMASALTEPEPEPPTALNKPAASEAAAAKIKPSKPPVDIDLGFGDAAAADSREEPKPAEEDDFIETVVIPPNAGARNEEKSRNSTDAFIARVKEQLSSSDSMADSSKDFTSTIPQ
ncbi:MAG: hypothetical protein OEU50_07595 [Gammaproteobacteria bacterium]|nr:hypothetical protein [Gammaproteobacteria bacterium]